MNWKLFSLAGVVACLALAGCGATEVAVVENAPAENAPAPPPPPPVKIDILVNNKQKIVAELYPAKAPETCKQILALIHKGFYNNQRFHRVEDWVIQWGDPQSKEANWKQLPVGSQGSGTQLPYESNDLVMAPGTVAMASTGEQVGGDSQIFILTSRCQPAQLGFLQGKYAAFGKVLSGMQVVDSLKQGDQVSMKRSAG